jgi:signal transduction histidine kinase
VFVPREPCRQAILNLVLEVIDHMERGGTLRIAIAERDGWALLSVADSATAVPAIQADPNAARLTAAEAIAAVVAGRVEVHDGAGIPQLVLSLPVAGR